MSFDASSAPFAGQSHFYRDSLEEFDANGQPVPISHQLLSPNAAGPSDTRGIHTGPQIGDETLIRRAANNLAARPVSEYGPSQGNPYPGLQWEPPRSPADYPTPGRSKPTKSYPQSHRQG